MNKVNRIEHGAAASVALAITVAVVWAFATMGYPAPAQAKSFAAGGSSMHCRPG